MMGIIIGIVVFFALVALCGDDVDGDSSLP